MASLSVLILAAGKGVRMRSSTPKVLHKVGALSMIERVVRTAQKLKPTSTAIVVGHEAAQVRDSLKPVSSRLVFFRQPTLNGSGGAVRQALPWIKKQRGLIIITCGDTPLLTEQTLRDLVAAHKTEQNVATVLTTEVETAFGYGRIVRGLDGRVIKIVEDLEATPKERKIHEINTGTFCFDVKALVAAVPRLTNKNQKKEYYLTDVLEILNQQGVRVGAAMCDDATEALGVNSKSDLAKAWSTLNHRTLEHLMAEGVTVIDPSSTYIDESVSIEQ